MTQIEHIRGDTLLWPVTYRTSLGVPINITGYTITSQLRSVDGPLIESLTVVVTNAAAGEITLSATAAQTAVWPIGSARYDVRYQAPGGSVLHTQPITVGIRQPVTA